MTSRPRGQQITELYAREATRLVQSTTRHVTAPAATIEDACAFAWEQLLTHPYVELSPAWRVRGWLSTVATRQAWRLARDREVPAGGFSPGDGVPGTLPEPADPDVGDPADRVAQHHEHEQRADDIAQLKPREQRDLALLAAGYGYVRWRSRARRPKMSVA